VTETKGEQKRKKIIVRERKVRGGGVAGGHTNKKKQTDLRNVSCPILDYAVFGKKKKETDSGPGQKGKTKTSKTRDFGSGRKEREGLVGLSKTGEKTSAEF